ncbi:mitochondrial fission ELM1 family protein [Curvivirga sp.]|uniref:mitochondrial fission ELM1 family protein n=1 Tax=Curvivirga sp. TaxID=2856848 RepID=UPI003B5B1542
MRICWVVSEDKAGMIAQARGLAESLKEKLKADNQDLEIQYRLIKGKVPWKYLPNKLWPTGVFGVDLIDGSHFHEPWPDIVISCARKAACPNAEIRRRANKAGKDIFTIHIQNPGIDMEKFDLVTTPIHDGLKGDNLIETYGSLGRVNRKMLDGAANIWREKLKHLPKPLIAVSVGGDNKVYKYTASDIEDLAQGLTKVVAQTGGGLMVTSSRRTSPENTDILKSALKDLPHVYWDGTGENPYFGYLGLADYVVVTCDSANMVSEACATGKPVFVFHVDPIRKTKFDIFHDQLNKQEMTRPFTGQISDWSYPTRNETAEMADLVLDKLGWLAK